MPDVMGAHVEVVEVDHEPGTGVLAMAVRVNGVDVGRLAEAPKVDAGDGKQRMTTLTIVLVPSRLEIKGDDEEGGERPPIGFTAP